MAEDLCVSNGSKEDKYRMLLPQIKCLIEGEDDLVANLANVAAALKETFRFFWVGFYLVKGDELVLAPFQGPVACTRIKKGRGVCGKHGRKLKRWSYRMWTLFRDISHAVPCHVRKSWFRCCVRREKCGACWMWIAKA